MKRIKILLTILLLSLGINGAVWGAGLPSHYPEMMPATNGVIGDIDIKNGAIVINDSVWKLSMNVKVHSLHTNFSSVRTLRAGMRVVFDMTSINGNPQVAEIWVVPMDYTSSQP